jgi:uncharacterized protein (DUF58 family)
LTLVPSARWLWGAAALAVVPAAAALAQAVGQSGPAAAAASLWALLNVAWVVALVADALLLYEGPGVPPAGLDVTREAPPAFSVGRVLPVWYRWSTTGRRRLRLRVRETLPEPLGGIQPGAREVEVQPGEPTVERVDVRPVRRGKGDGGALTVRVRGPLGLVWRQLTFERPWAATVFPNLSGTELRALPSQLSRRREAGLRAMRRPGEGRLFEGLREWVPGDDTRLIDWKATARRGKPIARQYEDERRQQVLIVIDAGRLLTAEIDGTPRLEAVIDAALHLAHAAVEHDDNIGIMVFDDAVRRFVAPARGRRALRAVLDVLAAIEGRLVEPDYPAAFRYLALRNRRRALTVLFTDVVDRTASEALVAHTATLRPRHLPLAVTLRDPALERIATSRPGSPAEAYQRAAAEELLAARGEALGVIRAQGVLVLDVLPAGASAAVVERYHGLKRRGML